MLVAPTSHTQKKVLKKHVLQQSSLEGRVALGQSSLARPGQLLQASPPIGLVVVGQRRRGGRKVKSSWEKAEFERKETRQDGKTTVEYSCLQCQRTLMSDHCAERSAAQEPPAQTWRVQAPVQPLCTIGGKAGARVDQDDSARSLQHVCRQSSWTAGCCRASCRGGCSSEHRCGADGGG